jgi:hypothetical protein
MPQPSRDVKLVGPESSALAKPMKADEPKFSISSDHPAAPAAEPDSSRWSEPQAGESLEDHYRRFLTALLSSWEKEGFDAVKGELPSDFASQRIRNARVEDVRLSFDRSRAIATGSVELESQGSWRYSKLAIGCHRDRIDSITFE